LMSHQTPPAPSQFDSLTPLQLPPSKHPSHKTHTAGTVHKKHTVLFSIDTTVQQHCTRTNKQYALQYYTAYHFVLLYVHHSHLHCFIF
jgi:hypothetical protein